MPLLSDTDEAAIQPSGLICSGPAHAVRTAFSQHELRSKDMMHSVVVLVRHARSI